MFKGEEADQFSRGLKIAGIITYADKYSRKSKFEPSMKEFIEDVLDQRLEMATREVKPLLLNVFELVSLKLVAISISKEQA